MKVHVVEIEPKDTPKAVAENIRDMVLKEKPELRNRKPLGKCNDYIVELYVKTDMDLFPLVRELRIALQDFMDKNPIKNDPMVFITTEFKKVKDKYTSFEGIENGSGYREWCSYDKGNGY